MLLDAIKEITNGRIVVGDAPPIIEEDIYKGKHYKIWSEGLTYFGKVDGIVDYFSASNIIQLKKNIKEVISETKDSQYIKSEYQERLTSLNNQLSQAKQLGDSEEAKEIQKEIDELKALEGGVQDRVIKDIDHELKIAIDTVKNPAKGIFLGGPTAEEAEKKLRQKYGYTEAQIKKLKTGDSDTEAKITDLTEKAKQARAQGYAADQYEVEIEKLKAKDKKTKDGRSKKEILEDIGEVKLDIQECKREHRFYGDLSQELKDLEQELKDTSDSKDILTQDPNK